MVAMTQTTPQYNWRARALAKPWYVLTYRNQDAINAVWGKFLYPGKVGVSLDWQGACLFSDPADVVLPSFDKRRHPWEIWRAEPRRSLRMQPEASMRGEGTKPTLLWVRSYEVVERMPYGFEYGPTGGMVSGIIEHLGSMNPHPPLAGALADPAYRAAAAEVKSQTGATPDHARWLAHQVFENHALANPGLGAESTDRYRAFKGDYESHMGDLITATLAGVDLPAPITEYWGLPPSGR